MKMPLRILLNVAFSSVLAGGLVGVDFIRTADAQSSLPAQENVQADPEALKKEIEKLRDEKAYEAKRVEEMRQEREQFVKEIRRVENLNQKYSREMEALRTQMSDQQTVFEGRLKKMESDLFDQKSFDKKAAKPSLEPVSAKSGLDIEKKANEVLMKGGDLDPEDEKFKEELARAHYNMGNVYFERGEYQRSAVEYYQTVDLMPYDADAHYNLAFVSGEYIGDQETALKHYQWYLYLKPEASDRKLVEEKIVTAKLHARSAISSRLDKSQQTGNLNIAR